MERERLINKFNADDNNRVHLFLLSTRAGCLGINLVGASRVVVFDASWNPCHDCQAVCRVYRYGQTRSCHVYRLVSDNTMERKIYNRQISKQGVSDRIVDEMNRQTLLERKHIDALLHYEDVELPSVDPANCASCYSDSVLVNVIKRHHQWLTTLPFMHESLLLDQKSQRLTRDEKRLAQQGYEHEKMMSGRPSARSFSPPCPPPARPDLPPSPHPLPDLPVRPPLFSLDDSFHDDRWSRSLHSASSAPDFSNPPPNMNSHGHSGPLQLKPGVFIQQIQATRDIMLPSGPSLDGETNKILAGENILVVRTPNGVFIRTRKGRVYSINSINQHRMLNSEASSAGWNEPYSQQQQSFYSSGSSHSTFSSAGGFDAVLDNLPYYEGHAASSFRSNSQSSVRYIPQTSPMDCFLSSSVISSSTSNDVFDVDPMSFVNTSMSSGESIGWNSAEGYEGVNSIVADPVVDTEALFSRLQPRLDQDNPGIPSSSIGRGSRVSVSAMDLPPDLLCIDAACTLDQTPTRNSSLPKLTVRQQPSDTDSLDSLTFDDYSTFSENMYCGIDPVLNGYESLVPSTHSTVHFDTTSSVPCTANVGTDVLDVDTAAELNELSVLID